MKRLTMALAGSRPKKNNNTKWPNKEIQEHQFVIDDIVKKLTTHKIQYQVGETITSFAGNVSHLKTPIQINSKLESIKKIATGFWLQESIQLQAIKNCG